MKIKRCPFCGGEAYLDKIQDIYPKFFIRCRGCQVETKWHAIRNDAITAWNTRTDNWISIDEKLKQAD